MQKNTFYSILFVAMLTGCAVIESSPIYSSEAIRKAELGQENTSKKLEAEKITDSIYLGLEKGTLILKKIKP